MKFYLTLTSEQLYGPNTDDLPEWPVVVKELNERIKLPEGDPHVLYSEERLAKVREELGPKLAKLEEKRRRAELKVKQDEIDEVKEAFRALREYEEKFKGPETFHPAHQIPYMRHVVFLLKKLKHLFPKNDED